jgi:hypothetical protein
MHLFVDVVHRATVTIVWLIVLALPIALVGGDPSNQILTALRDAGAWLAGPFEGMFDVGAARANLAAGGGAAALVYAVTGGIVGRFLAGVERAGRVSGAPMIR